MQKHEHSLEHIVLVSVRLVVDLGHLPPASKFLNQQNQDVRDATLGLHDFFTINRLFHTHHYQKSQLLTIKLSYYQPTEVEIFSLTSLAEDHSTFKNS